MQSLYVFRIGRQKRYVFPLRALKCAVISLGMVMAGFFGLDRIVLPALERRGLTAGDEWSRHTALVVREHQLSDLTVPYPEPKPALFPVGVRAWQGNPVEITKPAGLRRILVMGDSFVWGSPYLTLNHMWWRQLGQILEADGVEVIAVGRPGASTRDQLTWARHFVPVYKPDLIIWGYVTNDADEGLVRQISVSQQSIPKLDRVRSAARKVWPRMMAKFDALRSQKLSAIYTGPKYGYEYSEWELKLVEPDNLAAYSKTVAQVKVLLDETKIPGFMLTLPGYPSTKGFAPRLTPILKIWREAGIPAYDSTEEFVRRYGETPESGNEMVKWGINPADGHPGPRSCRFLAEQAAEILKRDFAWIIDSSSHIEPAITINDWLPHLSAEAAPHWDAERHAWKMECPSDDSRCPFMPLGMPTPLMAFKTPQPVTTISVLGAGLESLRVWASFLDKTERFDDEVWHDLGEKTGRELQWSLPGDLASRPLSVIRFQARFSSSRRELLWSFSQSKQEGK